MKCNFALKLPVMKKCCFCVPLRKGVIIFGYVNLVFCLLMFPFLVFLLVQEITSGKKAKEEEDDVIFRNNIVHLPLAITFLIADVINTIVLLIGAHKRHRGLLRVYFYCGILLQVLTLCMDLLYFDFRDYIENIVYFFCLGLNIYLLVLVYNVIHILGESRGVQYVSHCPNQNI